MVILFSMAIGYFVNPDLTKQDFKDGFHVAIIEIVLEILFIVPAIIILN